MSKIIKNYISSSLLLEKLSKDNKKEIYSKLIKIKNNKILLNTISKLVNEEIKIILIKTSSKKEKTKLFNSIKGIINSIKNNNIANKENDNKDEEDREMENLIKLMNNI